MTQGIHHITAIASDAAQTLHFYTEILGLRLVKKTVNQDDTQTYHLFFGDKLGHPGMDLTFFIFLPAQQGRVGNGQVSKISLAVPQDSLDFWQKRFEKMKVKHQPIDTVFGTSRLAFSDADGQQLELVGVATAELGANLDTSAQVWTTPEISLAHAIRCFYSARLSVPNLDSIEAVLSHVFGYELQAKKGRQYQYALTGSQRAHILEVSEEPSAAAGINAAGTVHHIAFRAKNADEQQKMRGRVLQLGLYPTEVINRFYFQSVYFRTPAGILFEIATDGPGFTADESETELGKKLALPPFLEDQRAIIESRLVPLNT